MRQKTFELLLEEFSEADDIVCRQPEELEQYLKYMPDDKHHDFFKLIQESYALRRYILDMRDWLYRTHGDEIEAMLNPPE